MITLLGKNISLVRPSKIPKPLTFGAWRKRRALRAITNTLTYDEKLVIARNMGYELKHSNKEMNHGK